MQRIMLFLLTNIAILLVLSISMRLLGLDSSSLMGMLVVAAVIGMGGAFISLALSKTMAKMSTGAQMIEQPSNRTEQWLLHTVQQQAQAAGIGMPEVAIYNADDMNAFATGMSRNNALVAVSSGLLRGMKEDEIEAVLAHEISHVANGDMVTMALLQGVMNTFVVFFSRIIGTLVDRAIFKNESGRGIGYWLVTMLAEVVLGILASLITLWFSRQREFRADAGAAKMVGAKKMIRALQRLQISHTLPLPSEMAALGIAGEQPTSWKRLFMTHPPLEERIAALKQRPM